MNSSNLTIIVLAAGKGKRMNNPDLPKVLAELSNKPLLKHVLDKFEKLNPVKSIIVVGHQKQKVIDYCNSLNINIQFAHQDEQLGTGHAVIMCKSILEDYDGNVLILAGDVPLIRKSTIENFIDIHNSNQSVLSVLTTIAPNPTGYGRIIRNKDGDFERIVEHKDSTEIEKEIDEINSGIFLVDSIQLFKALDNVKNTNAQKEYYLTDIVAIMKSWNEKVWAFNLAAFDELQGVNNSDDLKLAELNFLNQYS